jgi:hypothetical protein
MPSVKGKNVFLSGPMTGLPAFNVAEFAAAHETLNELGASHVFDPAFERFVEISHGVSEGTHELYMRSCLGELTSGSIERPGETHYELLVLLPGWESSEGSVVEREVAKACGIEVCSLREVIGDANPCSV